MSLLDIVGNYCDQNDENAEKALFDTAMKNLIENGKGYKVSDMLYEMFCCQKAIGVLSHRLEALEKKKTPDAPKRKPSR